MVVKLTTHFRLVPRLRISGAIRLFPPPHMPSRRGQRKLYLSLNGRLGGPQSRYGRFGDEKDLLPLLGFELSDRSARNVFSIPTTLLRLPLNIR
jgi:hypothetical protein